MPHQFGIDNHPSTPPPFPFNLYGFTEHFTNLSLKKNLKTMAATHMNPLLDKGSNRPTHIALSLMINACVSNHDKSRPPLTNLAVITSWSDSPLFPGCAKPDVLKLLLTTPPLQQATTGPRSDAKTETKNENNSDAMKAQRKSTDDLHDWDDAKMKQLLQSISPVKKKREHGPDGRFTSTATTTTTASIADAPSTEDTANALAIIDTYNTTTQYMASQLRIMIDPDNVPMFEDHGPDGLMILQDLLTLMLPRNRNMFRDAYNAYENVTPANGEDPMKFAVTVYSAAKTVGMFGQQPDIADILRRVRKSYPDTNGSVGGDLQLFGVFFDAIEHKLDEGEITTVIQFSQSYTAWAASPSGAGCITRWRSMPSVQPPPAALLVPGAHGQYSPAHVRDMSKIKCWVCNETGHSALSPWVARNVPRHSTCPSNMHLSEAQVKAHPNYQSHSNRHYERKKKKNTNTDTDAPPGMLPSNDPGTLAARVATETAARRGDATPPAHIQPHQVPAAQYQQQHALLSMSGQPYQQMMMQPMYNPAWQQQQMMQQQMQMQNMWHQQHQQQMSPQRQYQQYAQPQRMPSTQGMLESSQQQPSADPYALLVLRPNMHVRHAHDTVEYENDNDDLPGLVPVPVHDSDNDESDDDDHHDTQHQNSTLHVRVNSTHMFDCAHGNMQKSTYGYGLTRSVDDWKHALDDATAVINTCLVVTAKEIDVDGNGDDTNAGDDDDGDDDDDNTGHNVLTTANMIFEHVLVMVWTFISLCRYCFDYIGQLYDTTASYDNTANIDASSNTDNDDGTENKTNDAAATAFMLQMSPVMALAAGNKSGIDPNGLYIDSGSTAHFANWLRIVFSEYFTIPPMPISAYNADATEQMVINNVGIHGGCKYYHDPSLPCSLWSPQKAMEDYGGSVALSTDQCIWTLADGRRILIGTLEPQSNLYRVTDPNALARLTSKLFMAKHSMKTAPSNTNNKGTSFAVVRRGALNTLTSGRALPPATHPNIMEYLLRLHHAHGHPSALSFEKLLFPNGMRNTGFTRQMIKDSLASCTSCATAGKTTKRYVHPPSSLTERQAKIKSSLPQLCCDFNTFGTPSIYGKYVHALICVSAHNKNSRVFIRFLQTKQPNEVIPAMTGIIQEARTILSTQSEFVVFLIRSDEDSALMSKDMSLALSSVHASLQTGVPHEHETNARAEATICFITILTRVYIAHAALTVLLWPYAMSMAVFNVNNNPREILGWKSSNSILGIKYDHTCLFPWGSLMLAHVPLSMRQHGKLSNTMNHCILLSYHTTIGSNNISYRVLDLFTQSILTRVSVVMVDRGPFGNGRARLNARYTSSVDVARSLSRAQHTRKPGGTPGNAIFDPIVGRFTPTQGTIRSHLTPEGNIIANAFTDLATLIDAPSDVHQYLCKHCTLQDPHPSVITSKSHMHDISCPRFGPAAPPTPVVANTARPDIQVLPDDTPTHTIANNVAPAKIGDGNNITTPTSHIGNAPSTNIGPVTPPATTIVQPPTQRRSRRNVGASPENEGIAYLVNTNFQSHCALLADSMNKSILESPTEGLVGVVPLSEINAVLPKSRKAAWNTFVRGQCLGPYWDAAEKNEFGGMVDFRAVDPDPNRIRDALAEGVAVIGTCLVVTAKGVKMNNQSTIMFKKLKLRCVMLGSQEKIPPPMSPTHASVVSAASYNIFLSFITHFQLLDGNLDCSLGFLHATNPRKLLIHVSRNNMDAFRRCGLSVAEYSHLLLAVKAIYGVQDAGDHFFGLLMDVLINVLHFVPCPDDKCMLVLKVGADIIVIVVHVDDIPMASTNPKLMSHVIMTIHKHLDLGFAGIPMEDVLGTIVSHHRDANKTISLSLSVEHKIVAMATKFGLTERHPKWTPFPTGGKVTMDEPQDPNAIEAWETRLPYLTAIGILNNITNQRFDAQVAVSQLGGKRTQPSEKDYELLEHVAIYLYTTRKEERTYKKFLNSPELSEAHSDASFNTETRAKSRFSEVHSVLGNIVMTKSHSKACSTPTSSNASEVVALSNTCKNSIHIRRTASWLMNFFDPNYPSINTPIPVATDNAGALKTSEPFYKISAMMKHMEPKYFLMREYQIKGLIKVYKVKGGSSDEQKADFLTKHFGMTHFKRKKKQLGIYDPNLLAADTKHTT